MMNEFKYVSLKSRFNHHQGAWNHDSYSGDPTEAELQDIISKMDTNGSGNIDFHEFLGLIAR
uniref:EF-hand domain-containing protein n=1 Tax=Oryza punctata TaxID=4537 RepID=A0A0E0KGQ6_ORYPU